ncbi:MAG: reverse transcriptase family protein, partial [Nitrosopumilus sp.]|nr:reverse transcriptase family protein [Nitrosopumilus sp.]
MNNDQEPVFDYSKSNINNDKYTSLTAEITIEEVEEIINSMKNGKAPGNDSIPYEIFKNGSALMIKVLTNIMNNCRIQNYTPKKWKEGRIWMIHKSDSHYEPGNFRPITLLRTSYKIYTKLLFKRLQKVVEKNNLLTNNQAGFRKYRSCINKIRTVKNAIEDATMHNKPLYLLLIDFKKAFDSVHHKSLFEALDKKGIPHKFIAIIQDLYNDAYSDIITDYGCTEMFAIGKGVRQGCMLSTLIFDLVIDDVPKTINEKHRGYIMANNDRLSINSTLFADDLTAMSSSLNELQEIAYTIEECIENIGIEINIKKTEVVKNAVACRLNEEDETIIISGMELDVEDDTYFVKYLGLWLNANGSNTKHFDYIMDKIYEKIRSLHNQHFTINEAVVAINSLIIPIITYGCECFKWTNKQLTSLNSIVAQGFNKIANLKRTKMGQAHVFSSKEFGGLGVEEPKVIIATETVSGLHKAMNYTRDSTLRKTTMQRLKDIKLKSLLFSKPTADSSLIKDVPRNKNSQIMSALKYMKEHSLDMVNLKDQESEEGKILIRNLLSIEEGVKFGKDIDKLNSHNIHSICQLGDKKSIKEWKEFKNENNFPKICPKKLVKIHELAEKHKNSFLKIKHKRYQDVDRNIIAYQ